MAKERIVPLSFVFCFFYFQTAHAYIDPGSGSILFQLVIAFLIGGLFAIKHFWHNIVQFFKNIFRRKSQKEMDEAIKNKPQKPEAPKENV